jgi:hypothetical protein
VDRFTKVTKLFRSRVLSGLSIFPDCTMEQHEETVYYIRQLQPVGYVPTLLKNEYSRSFAGYCVVHPLIVSLLSLSYSAVHPARAVSYMVSKEAFLHGTKGTHARELHKLRELGV